MTARDVALPSGALAAARRGWFVFPTRPGGKEPRAGLSWPRAACNDPARLMRATWHTGENYGVAAKPSGLVVIDLDRPKPGYEFPPAWRDEPGVSDGGDVFAVLAERAGHPLASWPPETFAVRTPSGGTHLYYAAPEGRPIGNKPLGPLIDVRGGGNGDGGYVLGPGSVLGGRAYEVLDGQAPASLPAWIADLLDPPRPHLAAVPRPAARPGDRVAARLEGLIVTVLDALPGERNNVLHWAACRAAEMIAAGQLDDGQVSDSLAAAACRVGLDDGEARRTIASALRHTLRSSA
jgi:hypothetical protein